MTTTTITRIITPYWTTRDGVIGTVHKNRHGVEVDFRPATIEIHVDRLTNPADGPSWRFEAIASGPFGPLASLKIPAEIVSRGPAVHGRVSVSLRAVYDGAVIYGTGSYVETPQSSPEEGLAFRARLEESRRVYLWTTALLGRPDVLLRLGRLTHRDYGRLGSPRPGRWESRLKMIQDRVRPLLEIPDGDPPAESPRLGPETLRDALLASEAARRRERKTAWLALR